LLPQYASLVLDASDRAQAALGASRFEAAVAAGRELSRAEAIQLGLGEPISGPGLESDAEPNPLSRRETEIAGLVADGLTNKQISLRLIVSERTVDSHLRSILTKLGAGSRAQVAAWITASRLTGGDRRPVRATAGGSAHVAGWPGGPADDALM
jgi:non-specific serine/threonine protein kinase